MPALWHIILCRILVPVRSWRHAKLPLERLAERGFRLIANPLGDFSYRRTAVQYVTSR